MNFSPVILGIKKFPSTILGIRKNSFFKLSAFYLTIQIIIWFKTFIFFILFGKGRFEFLIDSLLKNPFYFFAPLFSGYNVLLIDFIFHQAMHFLIAICVFVFAKNIRHYSLLSLLPIFALASFVHNVSYWFTDVFGSLNLLAFDFVFDIILLYFFFFLFRIIIKTFSLQQLRFSLIE